MMYTCKCKVQVLLIQERKHLKVKKINIKHDLADITSLSFWNTFVIFLEYGVVYLNNSNLWIWLHKEILLICILHSNIKKSSFIDMFYAGHIELHSSEYGAEQYHISKIRRASDRSWPGSTQYPNCQLPESPVPQVALLGAF